MTDLERRYARWIALFYPADYRRTRGSELVDTYLSLAAPIRGRPSPADIADLAAGGLRQHLRAARDLGPGFRLAGLLALTTATTCATGWATIEAFTPTPPWSPHVGPFLSLAIVAWAVWLVAAVLFVAASGRWFRWAAGLAVLVTVAIVPAAALTGLPRPPLLVLLPQIVLGVVALGATVQHLWWVRLMPVAVAAAVLPVAVGVESGFYFSGYYYPAAKTLPAAAATLLVSALLIAIGLAARRDYSGTWAMLILLTPIGMLAVQPLSMLFDDFGAGRAVNPTWSSAAATSMLVAVIGSMLLPLALVARGRLAAGRRPLGPGPCPTCGASSASA
ncbi:hypothetical protein [Salinispora oceanensis]|uniref:hypothetical protein n=1 Tax=Salinispora oceanensis TaxID=1050199 RepID=UPI00037E00C5|nr:hypothetical protein [Salinispora oceanensis]